MNNVILSGRLARDPELSYTPGNQTAICHFTLAVDRPVSQGKERQADFIRITVFGRQAENCDRFLQKGRQAAVSGRIQTGSYKNREGITVYTTDVIADRVEFLGGGNGGNGDGASRQGSSQRANGFGSNDFDGNSMNSGNTSSGNNDFGGLGDLDIPDTFQAAEDDIPF